MDNYFTLKYYIEIALLSAAGIIVIIVIIAAIIQLIGNWIDKRKGR